MTGSHPTRSRLAAALRPAAFGADPAGERMERIRRSANFANGVFVNPVGARTAPSGSMLKFAATYFRKEERIRGAPAGAVPVHPTTIADLAVPPASGLRLTWMGHSGVLAEIGTAYGPFDATVIQIGAYSEHWRDIHMTLEEGMRAYVDLQGGDPVKGIMLPIHWGTFNLAPHPWEEPAEGTVTAARAAGAQVAVPRPGEPFEPVRGLPLEPWWRAIAARPATRVPAEAGGVVEPAGSTGATGTTSATGTSGASGGSGGADPAMRVPQSS